MDVVEGEPPQADAQGQTLTPADRIAELNEIDKVSVATIRSPIISTYTALVRSFSSALRRRRDPDPFQSTYHLTYLTRSSKCSFYQTHFYLLLHAFRHRSPSASPSLRS
jgi:hypothetical protein